MNVGVVAGLLEDAVETKWSKPPRETFFHSAMSRNSCFKLPPVLDQPTDTELAPLEFANANQMAMVHVTVLGAVPITTELRTMRLQLLLNVSLIEPSESVPPVLSGFSPTVKTIKRSPAVTLEAKVAETDPDAVPDCVLDVRVGA